MNNFQIIVNALAVCIQTRTAVLLTGQPGVAKTSIVEGLMDQLCQDWHTSIAALHEPPEYGGYPQPVAATPGKPATKDSPALPPEPAGVRLLACQWVNRLAAVHDADKLVGLFLDEISNAPPATRAAAMRGILDGVWGEVEIPRLSVIAAMNPAHIAESGYELSAPLANRFCHIDWEMPYDYWLEAMVAGFPQPRSVKLPNDWNERLPRARGYIAGFGHGRSTVLQAMPAEASLRAGPWPSYRSWTMATRLLAACLSIGEKLDGDLTVTLLRGCVGPAAQEFLTWATESDLPDPEHVLANPEALKLPERGDRAYAVLTGVTAAVLAKNTQERWMKGWKVLAKAAKSNREDVAAASARALAKNKPKDCATIVPKEMDAFIPILKAAGLM